MTLALLLTTLLYPQIDLSYEFHPRQSWPSHTESLTGDPWPIDGFWESNGLSPNYRDIEKGERHFVGLKLSWDFDAMPDIQIDRVRRQSRLRQFELHAGWHAELASLPSDRDLDTMVKRHELMALLEYFGAPG